MSSVLAPAGFQAAYHTIGLSRAIKRSVASGYGTSLFKNAPVTLNTNGTVVAAAPGADILGIMVGCEYIDATGRPTMSPYWPGGMVNAGGNPGVVWVAEDEKIVYKVQANGPVPATAIGDQADVVNPTAGSTATGYSTCALNSTLVGAAAQGQFRIVGFEASEDNLPGDPFTVVHVTLARSQFVANKVAV